MHFAQTNTLLGWPKIKILLFWRLGRNLCLLQRLILLPVPPLLLAKPLRVTIFPVSGPFPHKAQILSIFIHLDSFGVGFKVYSKILYCQVL